MRLLFVCALLLTTAAGMSAFGFGFAFAIESQAPKTGPVVAEFGPVYEVSKPDFETPIDQDYKVVFDVVSAPEDLSRVNPSIETAARFLNMHAAAGVPVERMHVAVVLHGAAGKYALEQDGFRKRFGRDNPSLTLLEQLRDAGVRVILCGQTAASRGFPRDELSGSVELALSAMTALITLQRDGYELIAF
jgi:intracellular sulfur oxidation DsrE/DsrF family protein